MNIHLERVLFSDNPYWLIEVDSYIVICLIPDKYFDKYDKETILYKEVEEFKNLYNSAVIMLNENFPPFQLYRVFSNIKDAYPIDCDRLEFLKQALELDSNKIWDYKKLIDKIKKDEK